MISGLSDSNAGVETPTLGEIFGGALATRTREQAQARRRGQLGKAHQQKRRSAMRFESFEQRLLLSADGIVGAGFTDLLVDGLSEVADELQEVIDNDPMFEMQVGGLLRPGDTDAGEAALVIPTVKELLEVSGDQNEDGAVNSSGLSIFSSLADRFAYVDARGEEVVDTFGTPPFLDEILSVSEKALDAMDLDISSLDDGFESVQLDEAIKVLFVGQIQQFLEDYPETYWDGDSIESRTTAQLQGDFLTFLTGADVEIVLFEILGIEITQTLTGFHTPAIFTSALFSNPFGQFFQMALTGETHDSAGDEGNSFAYSLNLRMEVQDAYLIDLGLSAEQAGVTLPINPFDGSYLDPEGDLDGTIANNTDHDSDPNALVEGGLLAGAPFAPLPLSFAVDLTGSFADSDYSFAIDDGGFTLGVRVNQSLVDLSVNVGFAGMLGDTGAFFALAMPFDATMSPLSILGITTDQFGVVETDGEIVGSLPLDSGNVVSSLDLDFDLTIGEHVVVTQSLSIAEGTTSGNTTVTDLVGDVQTELDAEFGLGVLVASLTPDDELSIALAESDAEALGFDLGQFDDDGFVKVIVATAAPEASILVDLAEVSILLAVGTQLKRVSFTMDDDDADTDVDFDDLVANLNDALDAAFGAGVVVASDDGTGKLQLASFAPLEIPRALTLDANPAVSLETLNTSNANDLIRAQPDTANDNFHINLPLELKIGLEWGDPGTGDDPAADFDIMFDPFDGAPVVSVVIADQPGQRFDLDFTANADFALLQDFTLIEMGDVVSLLSELQSLLAKLPGTELLGAVDIPFAQATLATIVDFADALADSMIYDDGDDGIGGDIPDSGKLVVDADPNVDVIALALQFPDTDYIGDVDEDFGNANPLRTAQELGQRLLQLSDGQGGSIITGIPHYDPDPDTKELTYRLDFSHIMNLLEVPIDFDFGDMLAPLFDLASESELLLFAQAFFDGIMGFELGVVDLLVDGTVLGTLNGGAGVDFKDQLALTGADGVNIVRGRISSDAVFGVSINEATPVNVTIVHDDTFDNDSVQDLLDDINDEIDATSLNGKIEAVATGEKITLRAIDPDANGIDTIRLIIGGGNSAITQLGLHSGYLSTVSVVAPDVPGGNLTQDYSFDVIINGGIPIAISPASGDSENTSVFHLVDDVNTLLADAEIDDQVRVEVQNGRIAFIAIGYDVETLTIDFGSNPDAELFGFPMAGAFTGGVYVVGNDFLADVSPANGNTDLLFGRLSGPANFTIAFNNGLDGSGTPPGDLNVMVPASETSGNVNLTDLIEDINAAIDAADAGGADGNQLVRVELDMTSGGARLLFRAMHEDIGGFTVEGTNDVARDELGIPGGTDDPLVADAHLQLVASKAAPAYYGVSGVFGTNDVAFTLNVEGNPVGTVFEQFNSTAMGVVDTVADTLNFTTAHGFHNGNLVTYLAGADGTAIGNLASGNVYYVVGVSGNSLQLSETQGGAAIDLESGAAGAFHSLTLVANQVFDSGTAVDTTSDEIAFAGGHDFANGDRVSYSAGGGTAVGNLTDGDPYFVIVVDANTIQLADSYEEALAGTARDLMAGGAGAEHTLKTTATGGTIGIPVAITELDVENMIPNSSMFALVSDVNTLLGKAYSAYNAANGTALINPFAVSSDGSRLVLTAVNGAVESFATAADNASTAVTELKLFEIGADTSGMGEQTLTGDTADLLVLLSDGGHFRTSLDAFDDTGTLGSLLAHINLAFEGSDSAVIDATDDTVFIASHGLKTGDTLYYRNASGGADVGDLDPDTVYYAIRVDADHFQVAASESDAFDGIFVPLTTGGAGTHSLSPIEVEVNSLTGNSLLVTDLNWSGGASLFRMTSVNDSNAAFDLGLFKSDISVGVASDSLTDPVATTPNGMIEGEEIGTVALEDRFFLREADASTPIFHADVVLTTLFLGPIEATGRFGFVGVELTGSAFFDGEVEIGLGDGGTADTQTLRGLSGAFSIDRDGDSDVDFFDITEIITEPVFTFSGEIVFDVAIADGLTDDFFDFGLSPQLTIELADAGDPFNIIVGSNTPFDATNASIVDDTENTIELTGHGFEDGDKITYFHGNGGTDIEGLVNGNAYYVIAVDANHIRLATTKFNATKLVPVEIDIGPATDGVAHLLEAPFDPVLGSVSVPSSAFQDLGSLVNFQDIGFEELIAGLGGDPDVDGIADLLSGFAAFEFMNTEIPLIGVTLNELLGIATGFQTAVAAIVQNQSKTLQEVEQKFRESLNLPPGPVFELALVDNGDADTDTADLLKIRIDLLTAFNEALAVDLDLSEELGLPFSLVGQAGLRATGEIGATLSFGVNLDDLADIVLFTDETEIVVDLVAAADNLTFNASLGPLGIFITGGDATFRIDASFRDEDAMAGDTVALSELDFSDLFNEQFETNLSGEIDVTLPVYFPTGSNFIGDITFSAGLGLGSPTLDIMNPMLDVPDFFNDPSIFENFSLFDSLPLLLDGIDLFLMQVQEFIDGGILSEALPFIGDQLGQGADFIESLREGLIQPLRDAIEQAPEKTGEVVQEFLFEILGPSGIGLLLPAGTDIAGQTATAVNALQAAVTSGAIDFTSEIGGDTSDDFIQWDVLLGDVYTFPFNVDFDLGWDGLGLDFHGGLDVSLGWDLGIGFGVSIADGAYLNIRRMSGMTVVDEMRIFLTATPTDEISATLGFLGLNIVDAVDAPDDVIVDENFDEFLKGLEGYVEPFTDGGADTTEFRAEFSVDLINGGAPSDDKLSFFELGDLEADVDLKAHAEVNVFMEVFFDVDLPGDFFDDLLPRLEGQFVLDWGVEALDILDNGFDFNGGLQLIEFRHVHVDLGQFIGDVLGPIVGAIQDFLEPFQPIIDILQAPFPVVSQIAGEDISIIDLAGIVGDFDPTFIEMVADLITFINSIPVSSGSVKLLLADQLTLMNAFNTAGDDLLDQTEGGLGAFLAPNFDFGSFDPEGFTGLLTDFVGELDLFGPDGFDLGALSLGGDSDSQASASTMKSLADGDFNSGEFGFDIPIFDNPTSLLGLLFGQNVVLFTYDLAPIALDFRWDQEFPVYPPIAVIVGFEVGFVVDLAFGYDTEGVFRFAEGGFQNPLDLLAGFYISDTDLPVGTGGVDVPEMVFSGGLSVGAGLSIGVASVSIDLTATIIINFDLYDPDGDGRVRFEELANTFLFEVINGDPVLAPLAIFDISLEIALQLSLSIEILLFEATIDITPRIVLAEFDIPFERAPILATELDNGDLMLNIGPNAGERLNGDVRDINEHIVVINGDNENEVKVYSPSLGVPIGAAQTYRVTGIIIADGGEGDDMIDLEGLTGTPDALLIGGSGNDTLTGGDGNDTIQGGEGDDFLTGSPGNDQIFGEAGNDEIHGGDDNDWLFGDFGSVSAAFLSATFNATRDGKDTIFGDAGEDVIFGSGKDDELHGGADDDVILGDGGSIPFDGGNLDFTDIRFSDRPGGGNDTIFGDDDDDLIFGGSGADTVDGGADDDTIYGQSGFDVLSGGTGADTIYGGTEDDRIYGLAPDAENADADGGDTLYGEAGNDLMRGNAGNDTMFGGIGSDVMFGDADNDTMFGENEPDYIFGGPDDDWIDAGIDNDVVFGDDGLVAFVDFYDIGKLLGFDDEQTATGTLTAANVLPAAKPGRDVVFRLSLAGTVYVIELPQSLTSENDDIGDMVADLNAAFMTARRESDGAIVDISGDVTASDSGGALVLTATVATDELIVHDGHRVIGDALLDPADPIVTSNDGERKTADLMQTHVNLYQADGFFDGDDTISGGEANDFAFGGEGDDTVFGDFDPDAYLALPAAERPPVAAGRDVLIGDGGRVELFGRRLDFVQSLPSTGAGDDTMSGNGNEDVIIGGGGSDDLYGRFDDTGYTQGQLDILDENLGLTPADEGWISDEDIIIGDDGNIDYDHTISNVLNYIETNIVDADALASGGQDTAFGSRDNDIMFGGLDDDTLDGSVGDDVIFGDNGRIEYHPDKEVADLRTDMTQLFSTDTTDATGGADDVEGAEGEDVIIGGVNGVVVTETDVLKGSDDKDIILGDNGLLRWNVAAAEGFEGYGDDDLATLDLITTNAFDVVTYPGVIPSIGGDDHISGANDDDILIGGKGDDLVKGDNSFGGALAPLPGSDVAIGDQGRVTFFGGIRTRVQAIDQLETEGGIDTIEGNADRDIILGGVQGDFLYGEAALLAEIDDFGDDIILGDEGLLRWDVDGLTPDELASLDLIESEDDADLADGDTLTSPTLGGVDEIWGNGGRDIAMGGTAGDFIYGDAGLASELDPTVDDRDILLGDNGRAIFVPADGDPVFDGNLGTLGDGFIVWGGGLSVLSTTDVLAETGGEDTIDGNEADDVILGGAQGDLLSGNDDHDIILGDEGRLEWLYDGDDDVAGVEDELPGPEFDASFTTLDLITTFLPVEGAPYPGGRDEIYGDTADSYVDAGEDVIFGGTDLDIVQGGPNTSALVGDVIFGDYGRIYPQNSALPDFPSRNFFAIDMEDDDGGEGDILYGDAPVEDATDGSDIMLGQQGDDRMWGGGSDDDMIGGHNRAGGYDELTAPAVTVMLNPDMNDVMDGGTGDDAMAGDNAVMWRTGDDISERFRALTDDAIYTTDADSITANVGAGSESDPDDAVNRDITLLDHSDAVQADPQGRFGADVMAGGADSDVMFGELGDDLMQGDGNIGADDFDPDFITRHLAVDDSGSNPDTDDDLYFNIPEAVTDADDYMEGNGGNDLMYGGLGQDDMIGGSSALFGLDDLDPVVANALRPDGSDIMFGGAGNPVRLERNDFVGATDTDTGTAEGVGAVPTDDDPMIALEDRHSRDADFIMGDNANIYRLVAGGASGTDPDDPADVFLEFNYDQPFGPTPSGASEDRGDERIVVRAMEQLDYTLGGGDFAGGGYNADGQATPTGAPADNGLADLIYGESGDDYIFGMAGSDVIYGSSDDDDIVGGYGHEWISGGTGQDGVLGDDGLLYTSRNSTLGEPLYGIAGLLVNNNQNDTKDIDGDVLDETISTPGDIQIATINVSGQLKKTADLTPFSFDPDWVWEDDEFPDNQDTSPFADDVMFGGLGGDFLHGGSGDDAISGAEALEHAYVPVYDMDGNPVGVLDLGYDAFTLPDPINPGDLLSITLNPGDVLAFNPEDEDGQHPNNRFRAGEFALYDEYDPRRIILLTPTGELYKEAGGVEGVDYFSFLLNFDESEGVFRPGGTVPKATGQQTETYGPVNDDGKDAIFGDNANDWLVGGTGRDDMFGGWGNDLLNADDDHSTNGNLNDTPDTHPNYEDRAYGGAGRDVLIANTGGDRLIDWVGEYNTYLVPFAPFGQATVSRTLQPFLPDYLYALSASDGADPTRAADTLEDPLRNGEPAAEMGLVLQMDFAWQDQTGAPSDPQAGNIPGGQRDVLRTAGFANGSAEGFSIDSGTWTVSAGKFQVAPSSLGGDALAVWNHDQYLPSYFELTATITGVKPTGGFKANAFIVFDYYSDTDFKFAGLDISLNKLVVGHRDASGWVVDAQLPVNGSLKAGANYDVLLALNGTTATLVLGTQSLTYAFAPRIDVYGIAHNFNEGMVGLGAENAKATIDNVKLQVVPPAITLTATDTFAAEATLVEAETGSWSLSGGRFIGLAAAGQIALATGDLTVGAAYLLQLEAKFLTTATGGVIFDQYATDDFKWAAYSKAANQVLLGHYTERDGWVVDKSVSRNLSGDVTLTVTLKGSTVSVLINGTAALSHVYNAVVTDGSFGLLARSGSASFDSFTVRTDDPSFAGEPGGLTMMASEAGSGSEAPDLDAAAIDALAQEAIVRWDADPALLGGLTFRVEDLDGLALAEIDGNTITFDVDAAGNGWFIDVTPADDSEFRIRTDEGVWTATPTSEAFGRMDLLTVVMHEIGHVLGLDHDDAMSFSVMDDDLAAGVRYVLDDASGPVQAQLPATAETPDVAATGNRPRLDFGDWMWSDGTTGPGAAGWATGWDASNGDESSVRTIDWNGGSGWNALSPFQGTKPGKGGASNVSDFLLSFGRGNGSARP